MPDWTKSLKFCAYKAQESGRLQRLSEKVREDQRRQEELRGDKTRDDKKRGKTRQDKTR